ILNPSKINVTAQLKDASKAFNDILKKYPNAKIKTYGHSLGSMKVQYALANMPEEDTHRIIGGWAYNGPNTYTELSPKQRRQMATSLKGKLQIYYDPKDIVGLAYVDLQGNPLPAIGTVYQVKSKKVDLVNQHMTYGYQLDKNGQIEIVNTNPATASLNLVMSSMSAYYSLKTEREKHGLTSNEEFFLDSTQASVIATGLVKAAETVKDEVEAAKKHAVEEAEELYQSTKTAPFGITELSAAEIQAAYAEAGVTYDSIVGKTERHFDKKVSKAKKLVTAYSDLQGKIQAGVNDAFAKDASLAGKFQEWSAN
ncbi:Mbeg1-like protein, partial [Streptococcus orisratti]